jgi:hypothetical protein
MKINYKLYSASDLVEIANGATNELMLRYEAANRANPDVLFIDAFKKQTTLKQFGVASFMRKLESLFVENGRPLTLHRVSQLTYKDLRTARGIGNMFVSRLNKTLKANGYNEIEYGVNAEREFQQQRRFLTINK